jgi:hypothetical protein
VCVVGVKITVGIATVSKVPGTGKRFILLLQSVQTDFEACAASSVMYTGAHFLGGKVAAAKH